jgi:small conductance mechanosensitive channel
MDNFWLSLKDQLTANTILSSAAVIIFNFIVYTIVSRAIRNRRKKHDYKLAIGSKGRTYVNLFVSVLRYVMILLTILIVLDINHVDVSTIIASVGVVSVIVGLALQDALKDIIRGIALISDSYFQVGDYVTLDKDVEGRVVVIGLKTTRIMNAADGSVISIANRNIEQVKVAGDHFLYNIPLPYDLKVSRAEDIIGEIVDEAKKLDSVRECKYLGVQELGDSSVAYRIRVDQVQGKKVVAKRAINKIVLQTCERHRVSIPYKQVDVHNIK